MAITTPIHTGERSIDRILGAGMPVLLAFRARPCPPCDQLDPALDRLVTACAGAALVAKSDARDEPGLVRRYDVTHLPGLVFVKDKAPVTRASGAALEDALRAWLAHLARGGPRPPLPTGPSMPIDGVGVQPPPTPARPEAATARSAGAPITLTDATFDRIVGASAQPVLVDFWAPWCGPCHVVGPIVDQLAREFAGRALVVKLNVDDHQRVAQRFGISGIPALLVFKDGRAVERLVGAQPAPALRQALARHISN